MGSEQHVVWCPRCSNLNIAHSATETFFDDYLPCQFCSGTCLRLPDHFGKYAVAAFASLMRHDHVKGLPLAELGRVIGQVRAQHAAASGPDPVATIAASAPELEDLLMCAGSRRSRRGPPRAVDPGRRAAHCYTGPVDGRVFGTGIRQLGASEVRAPRHQRVVIERVARCGVS